MSTVNSTISGDPREQRGAHIAATFNLRKRGDDWLVPSQSGAGTYRVRLGAPHPTCTCPDHQMRRIKCKQICAVEISLRREERPDGTTVVTKTIRTTYNQNWPAYNKAQTHETERFAECSTASAGASCNRSRRGAGPAWRSVTWCSAQPSRSSPPFLAGVPRVTSTRGRRRAT